MLRGKFAQSVMLKNYVECSNIGRYLKKFIITLLFIYFFFSSEILRPSEFCAQCDCTCGTAHNLRLCLCPNIF